MAHLKNVKSSLQIITLFAVSLFFTTAHAEVDMSNFCQKFKSCALAELNSQDISEGMRAMAVNAVNSMCEAKANDFSGATNSSLEKKANACLSSISKLSCDVLMHEDYSTPECEVFEKAVAH